MAGLKRESEFFRTQACVGNEISIDDSVDTEHRTAQTPLSPPVSSSTGTIEARPKWTVMQIGEGRLEYRFTEAGFCLCRAIGEDAMAASKRLLGPPTATSAQGQLSWKLKSPSSRFNGNVGRQAQSGLA